jgi:uncharacterized membrane protein
MYYYFDIDWAKYILKPLKPLQPFFTGLFILICGVCTQFSKSNFSRGAKLLLIALAVTLTTNLVLPAQKIIFGILHLLACCLIFYGISRPLTDKINIFFGIFISVLLYFLTFSISDLFIGLPFYKQVGFYLPNHLSENEFLFPFGIFTRNFHSADYFPLFPWMFVFFFGVFIGRLFIKYKLFKKWMYKNYIPFFSLAGRWSLPIYLIHQPVIYLILQLFTNKFKI